jgi:hypothetical protein
MAFFEFCKKGTLHTPTHVPSILMLDPAGFSRADDLTMPKTKPWTLISGLYVLCVSNVSLLSAPFSGKMSKMTRDDAFVHVPSCERLTPRGVPGVQVSI